MDGNTSGVEAAGENETRKHISNAVFLMYEIEDGREFER